MNKFKFKINDKVRINYDNLSTDWKEKYDFEYPKLYPLN